MTKQHRKILKLFIFILAINIIFLFSSKDEPQIIEHNTNVVTKIDTVFVTKIDTIYLKPKKENAHKKKKIEETVEIEEKTTNDISDDEKLCANERPNSETGYITEDGELHCYYCYTEINGVCVSRF